MKTHLLLFCLLITMGTKAQVKFCPPGAEWHYLFNAHLAITLTNEKIKYVGDTIIGGDTLKKISHSSFFLWDNTGVYSMVTMFKQRGDTIFLKNKYTSNNWQILYNFAAQPGQGWNNSFAESSETVNHYTKVDSIGQVTLNGQNLKALYVTMDNDYVAWGMNTRTVQIVERIGTMPFLFNYIHHAHWSDYDYFHSFLCYQDNSFGTYQASQFNCYANVPLGLNDENINAPVRVFPNPVVNTLNIEPVYINAEIIISDLNGKILKQEIPGAGNSINTAGLQPGMYFLQIKEEGQSVYKTKIIKE